MITRAALTKLIREESKAAGSQRKLAERWGVSPSYITDLLNELRDPGPKILDALGFERKVFYQRIRNQE